MLHLPKLKKYPYSLSQKKLQGFLPKLILNSKISCESTTFKKQISIKRYIAKKLQAWQNLSIKKLIRSSIKTVLRISKKKGARYFFFSDKHYRPVNICKTAYNYLYLANYQCIYLYF